MNTAQFREQILTQGYAIVPNILQPRQVGQLKSALERAIEAEREEHRRAGRDPSSAAMVLLCAFYGPEFIELCANDALMEPFESVLGEGCIVYAYTSSSMPPHSGNYSTRIHVDCPRVVERYVTNMGCTILLDDFSEENGATWFLPGSQTLEMAPSTEKFFGEGQRVIAPAGSVFYFNARLWHAGGENRSAQWRHALTINMCRSFMKQRIDIPRALAARGITVAPPKARQKLGYLSQPPASYEEYYLPVDRRPFQQKAE